MFGPRKFCQGRGSDNILSHQRISQRVGRTSIEKQLDPKVKLLLEGSIPVFLETYSHLPFSREGGRGSDSLSTFWIRPCAHVGSVASKLILDMIRAAQMRRVILVTSE